MFIGESGCFEFVLVLGFEDLGENVLELAVICLEDGVLGGQVYRVSAHQAVVEACAGETANRIIDVVLHLCDAAVRTVVVYDMLDGLGAVFGSEGDGELTGAGNLEVGGLVLVAERMTGDDDGLCPTRDQPGDVAHDDRFAENGASENIADGAIGGLPHFLKAEFLDACLIGGDGGALDADMLTLDCFGGVDRDLIVGGVAILDAQIIVVKVHVQIGEDQSVFDVLPNDTSHFIAIEFDDRAFYLNLGHSAS